MALSMSPSYQILVVDDQRSVRNYIVSLLQGEGRTILEAGNGKEAFSVLEKSTQDIDIILSDVDMPEMDGISFCEQLKSSERFRAIPVVMVSSFDSEGDVERGFQAGAHSYIPKGEVRERLPGAVRELLHRYDFRKQQTILVVDDSTGVRMLLADALSAAGFQVMVAENGQVACELLQHALPDLILSDISMPVMDGHVLFHRVQSRPETKGIPFVVMSILNERRHISRMIERGAAAYLNKPFNMTEMLMTVERLLSDQFKLILKEREKLNSERRMLLDSIAGLINALEARDAYTKGHSLAVSRIVVELAKLQGMTVEQIERLEMAAQLHDIGKIGIRDCILHKQGPLTPEEYDVVKTHSGIGGKIVSAVPSLAEVVPIIRAHHERYDGKGYPDRLQGEAIPLMARMIAVADTYDAMISNRPYRDGFVIAQALETIRKVKGEQLCPTCVDLFMNWIDLCGYPLLSPRELEE